MKIRSLFYLLLMFFSFGCLYAQAPGGFTYQAVVRDANGVLVARKQVSVHINILRNDPLGVVVYSELHHPTTNANGLFTIVIGRGEPCNVTYALYSSFAAIDWANGPYYLVSGTDPEGGSNYSVSSTQQLLSVPYALFANSADYEQLTNKPAIPTVPANISAFNNDAGYLTSYTEKQRLQLNGDTLRIVNPDGGISLNDEYVVIPALHPRLVDTVHTFDTTVTYNYDTTVTYSYDTVVTHNFDTIVTLNYDTTVTFNYDTTVTFNYDTTLIHSFDTTVTYIFDTTLHYDTTFITKYDTTITHSFDTISTIKYDTVFIADAVDTAYVDSAIAHAGYLRIESQTLADVVVLGNEVGSQIKNLQDPTDAQDAVPLSYMQRYVDSVVSFYGKRLDSLIAAQPVYSDTTATACDSFVWHGVRYFASTNQPVYVFHNDLGRDSIVRLNLTILHGSYTSIVMESENSLIWEKGNNMLVETTGVYTYTYVDVNGCTSVDTLHFTHKGQEPSVTPEPPAEVKDTVYTLDTLYVNRGYTYKGTKYVAAGVYHASDTVNVTPLHDSIATHCFIVSAADNVGVMPGIFSVASDRQICFSQGNLQYKASTSEWRFAENQYTVLGTANKNRSAANTQYIDLFGWATSGYHNSSDMYNVYYMPFDNSRNTVNTDKNYYGYGPSIDQVDGSLVASSANYDWGVYNKISNGGNEKGLWRTLTNDEWKYLLLTRADASSKHGFAIVEGVAGAVLLPDNWTLPSGASFVPNTKKFTSNVYTAAQWAALEGAGAIFLPAAGYANGSDVYSVGSYGYYWSTTVSEAEPCTKADYFYFSDGTEKVYYGNRFMELSVRLVREGSAAKKASCYVSYANDAISAFVGVEYNGSMYDMPGDYTFNDTLTNVDFCDSIVEYSLTVIDRESDVLPGLFSVADGQQVHFSTGNLQYNIKTEEWRFAPQQFDYVCYPVADKVKYTKSEYTGLDTLLGGDTKYDKDDFNGWFDLFGWGTGNNPANLSKNNADYVNFNDWGVNSGLGDFRTLSESQWQYLNGRKGKSGAATVASRQGVVLLPDVWIAPSNNTFVAGDASYASNTISAAQWEKMEAAGAVFLPAAGLRDGKTCRYMGVACNYWTSTFNENVNRYIGRSVRLVK